MKKNKKGMILIITLWVIVILLIISVAVAKMSFSNLFYAGYYNNKQSAINDADNGVNEVIARLIADNNYGKNGESLPEKESPEEYRDKYYFIAFEGSLKTKPSWLKIPLIYSCNNLGNNFPIRSNEGKRVVPPNSIDIISYGRTGNTIVRIEVIVNPDITRGDSITINSGDKLKIYAEDNIDIDSEESTNPILWSNFNSLSGEGIRLEITKNGKIDLHGGTAGSSGSVYISPEGDIKKEERAPAKEIPDDIIISDLATDRTSPVMPSGTYILESGIEERYAFYDDKSTPEDISDDGPPSFYVTREGIKWPSYSNHPLGKTITVDKGTLVINRNIDIDGSIILLKGKGIELKNGSYIYLSNKGHDNPTKRWANHYNRFGPDICPLGANWGDDINGIKITGHPDKLDPREGISSIPKSPCIDKPMYGNLSMFDGEIKGEGTILADGSVTIRTNSDPLTEKGISIYARSDINIDTGGENCKFTGFLYSHGDIISYMKGSGFNVTKDITITGAIIATGHDFMNFLDRGPGDPEDKGMVSFNGKNCNIIYNKKYIKAINDNYSKKEIQEFKISSWIVEPRI